MCVDTGKELVIGIGRQTVKYVATRYQVQGDREQRMWHCYFVFQKMLTH